ncbi:MAG TPA: fumarate/nitrate reduction transcriptional regulator Fnr [Burkholderiaceae bacterium]|nr:fumarate/nitrate reduction transcriptional regulator Fnr [Burkholderiaceae bacterium]
MLCPTVRAPLDHIEVACSNCSLRELCLPVGLAPDEMQRLDGLVSTRRNVKRGEVLFRDNDAFTSLYAIRAGFFKTCATSEDGRDQVTGFMMAGDLMGFDGIGHDRHRCDAVALEDSQVCVIPYARLDELSRDVPELQRQLNRVMSREIVREHGVMMMLAGMRAEERVTAFLSNLAQRLEMRGFSPSALILRMTRQEIGTYLGLKLETVSRCFTRLRDEGILDVHQRNVRILDAAALQRLVKGLQRSRA